LVRDDSWHQGVVGLIAGRLKERFHRPALAFTLTTDGTWTGSARSVPGLDIGEAVHHLVAAGHAAKGGGHAMAAGLTVEEDAWAGMCDALLADLTDTSHTGTASQSLEIDSVLTASGASLDLAHAIEKVAPYGTGFPNRYLRLPATASPLQGRSAPTISKQRCQTGRGQACRQLLFALQARRLARR
jgi:single-stranded-DNA-specific exonuclease